MAQPEPMEYAISASGVTTESQPIEAGSNPKKRKREDPIDNFQEISLTDDHMVVVCRDEKFQMLAEMALHDAFKRHVIEFDKTCKMGKMEYKRPRGTAFYAIPTLGGYKYGGVQDIAHNINDHTAVFNLLTHANQYAGPDKFTGVLLNFYRSGDDCIALHSDKDVSKDEFLGVLSISLGITRQLRFVNNSDKTRIGVDKHHGTILAMCGMGFQEAHKHEMKRYKKEPTQDSRLYLEHIPQSCTEIPSGPWHASFTFRRHSKSLKNK